MEPLAIHIHEIPGVGLGADGETGDVRRRAEELQRSGVGAAGGFQLPRVGREGLGDAGGLALLVSQQGADVVVEVFHPFPVAHFRRGLDDRLDEVQGRLVVLQHLGGHGEVVQVLPVVGEVLRYMMLIPQHPLHPPDQVLHRAVIIALGHHGVGRGGVAGTVHHRLADGVVQLPAVHAGKHAGVGLLTEVLPAPVIRADGVGFRLRDLRRLGVDGQQGRGHGSSQEQGQDFFAFHA